MIYLDFNATTPILPGVMSVMESYWNKDFGNSSSKHIAGRIAKKAVDKARNQVAAALNCQENEIVFTSGATESNNIVLLGLLLAGPGDRNKVAVSAIEHKSVLEPAKMLARYGFELVILPVDRNGSVDLAETEKLIDEKTVLVSVQLANNEIGTIQPVKNIAAIAHSKGAYFHTDAVQGLGKMLLDLEDIGCDFASFSAHKIYGPKGVGALFTRSGPAKWPFERPLNGGGQEGGLRPGTHNVPGIVGFGEACQMSQIDLKNKVYEIEQKRNFFENFLSSNMPSIKIHAKQACRLCNTTSFSTRAVPSDLLIDYLADFCMSRGSACSSGAIAPSHVLEAIGCTYLESETTIRISLGFNCFKEDIQKLCKTILDALIYLGGKYNNRGKNGEGNRSLIS